MIYTLGVVALVTGLLASIALHEYGHMAVARKLGVKVTDFMIGFGPRLWSRMVGETEVGLRLIPLGGYIRMIGMYPPHSRMGESEHANLEPADRGRVFHAVHPAGKIAIMVAGPAMNLLLAVTLIALAGVGIGIPTPTTEIGQLRTCAESGRDCGKTPAQQMGLRSGDKVLRIGDAAIATWPDLVGAVDRNAGEVTTVVVRRAGSSVELEGLVGGSAGEGFLGVSPGTAYERVSPGDVAGIVSGTVVRTAGAIIGFPERLVELAGVVIGSKSRDPNGPVGVVGLARISGEVAEDSRDLRKAVLDILLLLAGLNVSLFVFNLIPLVPLDGGNAFTALVELLRRWVAQVRGRPIPAAVDGARLLPLTYTVALFLLAMAGLVTVADIVEPLSSR
jgi:membrane-associated protease RseP (regulator of RpoE activity)